MLIYMEHLKSYTLAVVDRFSEGILFYFYILKMKLELIYKNLLKDEN